MKRVRFVSTLSFERSDAITPAESVRIGLAGDPSFDRAVRNVRLDPRR
ncbi:hypothetical protein [Halogranum amylolyticum]|nr:hypothetical protein [Halogranum amylolyticum]